MEGLVRQGRKVDDEIKERDEEIQELRRKLERKAGELESKDNLLKVVILRNQELEKEQSMEKGNSQ